MHAGNRVADRHRAEGVAVIAVAQGDDFLLVRIAHGIPILQGHLEGHFHRYRTGVAEENPVQGGGGQGGQELRELDRRWVG